jgi:hypothetical protein
METAIEDMTKEENKQEGDGEAAATQRHEFLEALVAWIKQQLVRAKEHSAVQKAVGVLLFLSFSLYNA